MISYIEVKRMVKEKQKKELTIYLIIMVIAVFYSCGTLLKWNLPKPGRSITKIYEPISKMVFTMSKDRTVY
ncbi:MAG: hypothetical protein ACOYVK_08750 [Bacillota bacterium]